MESDEMNSLQKKYAMTLCDSYCSALKSNHLPHTNAIVEVYLEGRMATGDKTGLIKYELSHLESCLCVSPFDWLLQKVSHDHGVAEARRMIERARDEIANMESSMYLNIDYPRLSRESAAIPLSPQEIDWSYLQIIDSVRYAEEKIQGRLKNVEQRSSEGLDTLARRFEKHVKRLVDSK